nr:MAG TPA: hypothetical protein [Caudoviricetes sp.]
MTSLGLGEANVSLFLVSGHKNTNHRILMVGK